MQIKSNQKRKKKKKKKSKWVHAFKEMIKIELWGAYH